MIRQNLIKIILGGLVALAPVAAWSQDSDNGTWWKLHARGEKTMYVVGFRTGIATGIAEEAATAAAVEAYNLPKEFNKGLVEFLVAYHKQMSTVRAETENATAGQVVDGVDTLYNDYKNQLIPVRILIRISLQAISGKSQDEIENQLNIHRKRYSKSDAEEKKQ